MENKKVSAIMENKKVSVIMGVYNSNIERLDKAIDSILCQTYKNLELIICDDASTNGIKIHINKMYGTNVRVRYICNTQNRGLAYSLNRCLEIAQGEYIARQDDDDFSFPNRIQKQVVFLEENKEYGLVGSACYLVDENGVWGKSIMKEKPDKKDLLYGVPFTHPTIMVRKEVYKKVEGYRTDKITRRTEDYDFYMRIYSRDIIGYNLKDFLLEYMQDNKSYKKQKFKYRLDEVQVKYRGFKELNLFPKGYLYILKPIISGLIPCKIKNIIYKIRFSSTDKKQSY